MAISVEREEEKRRVKDASDIVLVAQEGGIKLIPRGRSVWALCPFHQEKTPSFHIRPDEQIFKCFGCGKSGDVFTLVMAMRRTEFPEALEYLAGRANIQLSSSNQPKNPLYDALEAGCRTFQEQFSGSKAEDYMKSRNFLQDTLAQFRIGYAPSSWEFMVNKLWDSFPPEILESAGLIRRKKNPSDSSQRTHYDYFRDRVMFPVFDLSGRVIAFVGRRLTEDKELPKYLNSPDSSLYRKGQVLYGINFAKKNLDINSKSVVVVEGYTDVMHPHQAGMPNVIGTGSTAFTPEHATIISRKFPGLELILCFDGDEGGKNAAMHATESAMGAIDNLKVCLLPEGCDPANLFESGRTNEFAARLSQSRPAFEYYIDRKMEGHDISTLSGKLSLLRALKHPLGNLPEELTRAFTEYTSQKTGLSADAIQTVLGQGAPKGHQKPMHEERLLRQIIANPSQEIISYVSSRLSPLDFSDLRAREVYLYLQKRLASAKSDGLFFYAGTPLFELGALEEMQREMKGAPDALAVYLKSLCTNLPNPPSQRELDYSILEMKLPSLAGSARNAFSSGKSLDDVLSIISQTKGELEK